MGGGGGGGGLFAFAADDLDDIAGGCGEVRFLNHNRGTRPKSLFDPVTALFWFVRLRAIVSFVS